MKKRFCIMMVVAAAALAAAGQAPCDIFSPSIRSVKTQLLTNAYMPPIMVLGTDEQILVSFDDMAVEHQYLRYSVVHCDANWQPSDLLESEYVSGFNYANITEYAYSSSTFSHYVHYEFTLPNEDIDISKSGNYLVKVYPEDDSDAVLFQAGFYVSENKVTLSMDVTSRTDMTYNNKHQQVSAKVNMEDFDVRDPYNDLNLVVTQNSRRDTEVMLNRPFMVSGNEVEYDHMKSLIFMAGNEFRRMEMVDVNTINMGVERIVYAHPLYHAELCVDEPRCNSEYLYDSTQYGRFTIRNRLAEYSETMAEYMITHFTLNTGGPLEGGKIYLDGEFTNHLLAPDYMMRYDSSSGTYMCEILLKQGAYNYQYLWVPNGDTKGYTAKIEGDKYETVNEYFGRVYYRTPNDRYDRLIAYNLVYSGK